MSPYPLDPVRAVGPMRLVLSNYPSHETALRAVDAALDARLAACANIVPIDSRYWWNGTVESAHESLVLFKTVPKRVGALLRLLKDSHPYETPEIVELDIPRVDDGYLGYLLATLDPSAPAAHGNRVIRRSGARRGRAARVPGRTRAQHHRRSR